MTDTAVATEDVSQDRTYGGLLGAFPYAFRESDSRLFRSYAVVGGLVSLAITFAFVLALIYLIGGSFGAQGGVFTFSRSFYIAVALFVTAPILAPVLLVARHHRRTGADRGYDRTLAASGYLFLLSLYVMLVISTPESLQDPVGQYGALAPLIRALYDLPPLAGLVPPVVTAAVIYLVHRWQR